jgi:hypothetical protein
MGVGANSDSRHGNTLRDQKARGAGRQDQQGPEAEAINEFLGEPSDKPVDGAFGKDGVANREGINSLGEGGGGGGGAPNSDIQDVNPGTRK